jgi:hypothetical protein
MSMMVARLRAAAATYRAERSSSASAPGSPLRAARLIAANSPALPLGPR